MWDRRAIEFAATLPKEFRCYIFGSSIDITASPADIDILIVYPDNAFDAIVRYLDENESAAIAQGLDLTTLSESEEAQVGFISLTRALPLKI